MKKSFNVGFDALIGVIPPTFENDITEKLQQNNEYMRTTIAIKSQNLDDLRIICLKKKIKLRDVINYLIAQYINKHTNL